MPSFNKIIICGYLGRDPELKYSPSGTAVCKFSVATTERRKNSEGEQEEGTTWFRCVTFGRQAEVAEQYLSKGSPVYLEGRLRQEEFVDREGRTRTSLEVTVTDVQFLGSKQEKEERSATQTSEKKQAIQKALGATSKNLLSIEEDDIPFN